MNKFILSALVTIGLISCTPASAIPDNICEIQNLDFSSLRGWSTPDPKWDGNGINTEMRKSPDGALVVGKLFYGKSGNPVGSYNVSYGGGKTRIEYCLSVNLVLQVGSQKFPASGRSFQEVSGRQFFFWLD